MSKRAVILLAALAAGIVFASQIEAQAVVKQSPTSINVLAPLSVSGSRYSDTSDTNHFPTVPHRIISDFLFGVTPQAYWMQSTRYRGQIYGYARTGYGVELATGSSCKLVQQVGQLRLTTLDSLSGSLSSLSPPGLILRL